MFRSYVCLLHTDNVVAMGKGRRNLSLGMRVMLMDTVDNAGPEKGLHEEP